MVSIAALQRQALLTFKGQRSGGNGSSDKNYAKLYNLMNQTRAEDVGINSQIINNFENQLAPICVMEVFENDDITIVIFLMKRGITMPMHDHPGMHGLLKVLHGTASITNYTLKMKRPCIIRPGQLFIALRHPTQTVTSLQKCCDLRPDNCNVHEISSLDGSLVFLDILSPPYVVKQTDPMIPLRPCTFFREFESKKDKSNKVIVEVQLEAIEKPDEYYCERMPFPGLKLD